ncbi:MULTISPECIES: fumarylacetoacetate hydrolase family protein [Comamonas]|uniref:fumarylacetoacetate hydrolase family protein n=1 Tax=Comamonas TaxID=283 RepID=UPI00237E9861|nr:fumarylacetoacetate hydrolase family protein [Comamonas aquatica]MDE1557071.1 fumarylacetoacetate hydrolase family protein [Comamonas aquatica]
MGGQPLARRPAGTGADAAGRRPVPRWPGPGALAGLCTPAPSRLDAADLHAADQRGPAQAFTGTHSLQDPTWLLAGWLQHVTQHYGTVPAGTVVTTGTWTGCPAVQAGDRVQLQFDGLGAVAWQF